jgi:hypothetical protein
MDEDVDKSLQLELALEEIVTGAFIAGTVKYLFVTILFLVRISNMNDLSI